MKNSKNSSKRSSDSTKIKPTNPRISPPHLKGKKRIDWLEAVLAIKQQRLNQYEEQIDALRGLLDLSSIEDRLDTLEQEVESHGAAIQNLEDHTDGH